MRPTAITVIAGSITGLPAATATAGFRVRNLTLILLVFGLSGCCIDVDENIRVGNIITYENGRVCTDSTQRGLANAAKICFARVCR